MALAGAALLGCRLAAQAAGPGCRELHGRAEQARQAGRVSEAVPLFERALRCDARNAEAWWGLGTVLYSMDRYAEAARAFRAVTGLAPAKGDAFAMLGLCEARLGRSREALAHLRQARRLGLRSEAAFVRVVWYQEALLLLARGDFNGAQERLEALARDGAPARELAWALGAAALGVVPPQQPEAREPLRPLLEAAGQAQYFAARKEIGPAKEYWLKFLEAHGGFRNAHFAFGRFLVSIYDDDGAVREFSTEAARDPDHLPARLGLAGILAGRDPEAALPHAEKAAELAPRLGEARFLLGLVLLNLGRTGRAIAELEQARRLEPLQAKVYFQLARAYAQAGRAAEAASARRMFLRLGGADAAGQNREEAEKR